MDNKLIKDRGLQILCLYLDDYTKELYVREIARLLDQNHRSVLLALNNLEEKKVLRSRMVGKNKLYTIHIQNIISREYILFAESFNMLRLIQAQVIFKKFLAEVVTKADRLPIILFGSYARGTEKRDSDVDLVLFVDHHDYSKKNERRILDFFKKYRVKVQIQKASKNDFEKGLRERDPLVMEIVKNHVIFNCSAFFVGMLWRYAHER